jgi:hypothetical protein
MNPGSLAGIPILPLVKTLSVKGMIIVKEIPSKIAEKIMHTEARLNNPTYGLRTFSNFK